MNYSDSYTKIIENRKQNIPIGYSELHHIVPKSMGGSNKKYNIVRLTAREHYICHYLLLKINKNTKHYYSMLNAFLMMCVCSNTSNQKRIINSKTFEIYKTEYSKYMSIQQSGEKNSQYGNKWYHSYDEKKSKSFKSNESIPDGWYPGRIINWNKKEKEPKKIRKAREPKPKKIIHNICGCGRQKLIESLTCQPCYSASKNTPSKTMILYLQKYKSNADIAKQFNISRMTVWKILNR